MESYHSDDQRMSDNSHVDMMSDARVLFDAIRQGKTHLVRFILEAALVDVVNARDLHGKTPLITCCYTKEERAREKMFRVLTRQGADINLTDDFGRTALTYACERRCNDMVRMLVRQHNIDPDIVDEKGNTALIYSAMVGNDVAVDILVRHFRRLGLEIDHSNHEGYTALLMASRYGHVTCAQILVGQGRASVRHKDRKYGLTVEEWLKKHGFTLDDISPVRVDGRGRSRFLRLANVAAICTGKRYSNPSMTTSQSPSPVREAVIKRSSIPYLYPDTRKTKDLISRFKDQHLGDDQYLSDDSVGTGVTDTDHPKNNLLPPLEHAPTPPMRAKLKHQTTQTSDDSEAMSVSSGHGSSRLVTPPRPSFEQKARNTKQKRFTLPEIEVSDRPGDKDHVKLSRRQSSIELLPRVLIAKVDLGNGLSKSIRLKADAVANRFYWKPFFESEEIGCLSSQDDFKEQDTDSVSSQSSLDD